MADTSGRAASEAPLYRRFLYGLYRCYTRVSDSLQRHMTPAGWLVMIMIVTSAAVGLDTRATLAYQMFTLLVALLLFSCLAGLCFRPKLRVSRSCPRFGSVGERLTYRVHVWNERCRRYHSLNLREPLGRGIPERTDFLFEPEPGEAERNRFDRNFLFYRWLWLAWRTQKAEPEDTGQFAITSRGDRELTLGLTPLKRGVLHLSDIIVQKADPFGLIKAQRRAPADQSSTITILPKRYRLPPLELAGRSQYQPRGVALAGSVGQSEEILGLRQYTPGDPLRHIHWKTWARIGKPFVMEFEDEFFPRYALALDTFAPFDHGGAFEEAVSVAASCVCTLDTKDSLLDLMFVGTEAYCFTSGRNTSPPERLLEILASVELCRTQEFSRLEGLILSHMQQLSACVCVFLSWDDERRRCIERLRANGLEMLVLVIVANAEPIPEGQQAADVRFLHVSKIAEGLAKL